MVLSNSEARETLEQIVVSLEEVKAGIETLKEQHDQGSHEVVGELIVQFQYVANEISNVANKLLEGMREHEAHECPECARRETADTCDAITDVCSWCGRSLSRLIGSKEQMALAEKE